MNRHEQRKAARLERRKARDKRATARDTRAPARPVLQISIPKTSAEHEHLIRLRVAQSYDAGIVKDARAVYAGLACGFVVGREIEGQLTPDMLERWDKACERASALHAAGGDVLAGEIFELRKDYGV